MLIQADFGTGPELDAVVKYAKLLRLAADTSSPPLRIPVGFPSALPAGFPRFWGTFA